MTDKQEPTGPRIFSPEQASLEFMDAVCHASGCIVIECGHCRRVHFVGYGDHGRGVLEELRENVKREPLRYIEDTQNDSLACGMLEGKVWPWNCPCNAAKRYEEFIWTHRELILRYLTQRAKVAKNEAASLESALNAAK